MKNLFLSRHGKYNKQTGRLTPWGTRQVEEATRQTVFLHPQIRLGFYVLCATALRAVEAAKEQKRIIQPKIYGIEYMEELSDENLAESTLISLIDNRINGLGYQENVFVVGHYDNVAVYGTHILETKLGEKGAIIEPETGEILAIDLERKSWAMLPM